MFSNVLVGVDGSRGGRDAIALSRLLAAPRAQVTLAYVYGSEALRGRGSALEAPLQREEAQRRLEGERAAAVIDANLVTTGYTTPRRGLHELAEQRRADLLVVGSSRHALLGRALMGDDARAVSNGAPCAVAVAPAGFEKLEHDLRLIGVGYDGSPESEAALVAARDLASLHHAQIKALWVVSPEEVRHEGPAPSAWSDTVELLLNRRRDQLRRLGGVREDVACGSAREELMRLGDQADLLVVGSRGYGPIGRLFHGSVSSYLAGHVACPLLVLPRSAGGQDEAGTAERSTTAVV